MGVVRVPIDRTGIHRRRRWFVLSFLMALWLMVGVRTIFNPSKPSNLADLSAWIANGWLQTLWCAEDAKGRGRPLMHAWLWLTFLFWYVAVPVYLLWSRRWRGVLWLLGYVLTLAGCAAAGHYGMARFGH